MRSFFFLLFFSITTLSFSQDFWEPTNGPQNAFTLRIAVSPNGHIFVNHETGIFRSTDDGVSWRKVYNGNLNIFSLLVINNQGDIFHKNSYGLHRSTDDGITWTTLDNSHTYTNIAVAGDNTVLAISGNEIRRSTDNGNSWIPTTFPAPDGLSAISVINGKIYIGGYQAFYCSSDNGNSWDTLHFPEGVAPMVTIASAINEDILIGGYFGVFRSTDNGLNWVLSNTGLFPSYPVVNQILCNTDGTVYAISDSGIFISTNNGDEWYRSSDWISSFAAIHMAKDTNGNVLVSSRDFMSTGGVYKSSDKGESWKRIGLPLSVVYQLHLDNQGGLYALHEYELSRSVDKGQTWEDLNLHSYSAFQSFAADSSYIYLGSYTSLLRSSNKGKSWETLNNVSSFALATEEDGNLLRGTTSGDLYRSNEHGITWSSIYHFSSQAISCIAAFNNGEIFVSVPGLGFHSTDKGVSWSTFTIPGSSMVSSFVKTPNGYYFVSTKGSGILKSLDGDNWITVNSGIFDQNIYSMVTNSFGRLYASTYSGVYVSTNYGDSWTLLNSGLNNLAAISLTADKDDYIFVGTNGNGVNRSLSPTTSVNSEKTSQPGSFSLGQNYPNPFNSMTNISYSLTERSHVVLKVYDILGKEVAVLVNEEKPAGKFDIRYDAGNLFSGMYFYRLEYGTCSETRKFILLK